MFIDLSPTDHEAVHNLINLHLVPEYALRIGQSDAYAFRDAKAVLERTGNLYSSAKDAMTYRYTIDGPGFDLCALAVWGADMETSADVHVVSILPAGEEARLSLREWLNDVLNSKLPPRDLFLDQRWQ